MGAPDDPSDPEERIARLTRRVEREKTARREAERLLESKSLELFTSNVALQDMADTLERRVEERTDEIRKMQEALRHSQKMEAVGLLAGGVAHDFNNLLMVIDGAASLLADAGPDERTVIVGELASAVRRGRELTSRLLAFSRKSAIEEVDIELRAAVLTVLPLLRRLMTERVEVVVDIPTDVAIRLTRGGVDQLLFNLAANARDAMPRGGTVRIAAAPVTVSAPEAAVLQIEPGDYVQLEVSDTGDGMDPDTAQRAFDPFFSTKPVGAGNGLGLATVYSLVRQANGSIAIRTAVGEGTTFRILLPRVPVPAMPTTAELRTDQPPLVDGGRVLVVDDDDAVRRTVSAVLRRQRFETCEASGADEALEQLAASPADFDLVVSDVRMPGTNGFELAQTVRSLYPSLPVLLVSGFVDDASIEERIHASGLTLMHKPFDVPVFLSFVNESVRARRHRALHPRGSS